VILGRGVIQLSGLVDTLLVSFLGTGANAVFQYAQMLYLLPMSLLGTGEAAVSLPEMARDTAESDIERRNERLRARLAVTLTRVAVLSVPAMALLMVFGVELTGLVLEGGRFDDDATRRVAEVLVIYGGALIANASGRLLATTWFALGDTRVPARLAVVRVVASTLLSLLFMPRWDVRGVVLGAAMAGWIEALLLGWTLNKRLGGLGLGSIPALRLVLLAALTFGVPALARLSLRPLGLAAQLAALIVLTSLVLAFVLGAIGLKLLDPRSLVRR
jgi:putative peptidoglycan lipid II flippase